MHEVAFKITLKAVVRSLNDAHEKLEAIPHTMNDVEKDILRESAANSIYYTAARVENILAHLEQDVDVDLEFDRQLVEDEMDELNKKMAGEYEALFRQSDG